MHTKSNIWGRPCSLVAGPADGPVEAVFGPTARVAEWYHRDGGGSDGLIGTYAGRPVLVSREEHTRLVAAHGLTGALTFDGRQEPQS